MTRLYEIPLNPPKTLGNEIILSHTNSHISPFDDGSLCVECKHVFFAATTLPHLDPDTEFAWSPYALY